MKKLIVLISFFVTILSDAVSQNNFNWEAKIFFGYQKHDKRFFGISEENAKKEGDWGTSQYGINFNKTFYKRDLIAIQAGLGYARETNTYLTPYDHCCFNRPGAPCTMELSWIDRYDIDLIQTSINVKFKMIPHLYFNLGIISQFNFHKKVGGFEEIADFMFDLYSIEFNPGIECNFGRLNLNLGYRLFQLKTIDKVYIYGNNFLSQNPGYLDRTFDTYNPTKLLLSIGFIIN